MRCKFIVIDLDGTLLKDNSFHFFLTSLLGQSVKNLSFYSLWFIIKILVFSILRKLKLCSHECLKKELQKIWVEFESRGQADALEKRLRHYLKKSLRTDLLDYINKIKEVDDTVILATAAPEEYVCLIAKHLSIIDIVIATPSIKKNIWFHNLGQKKWENISFYTANKNCEIVSFTDHFDDLPLISNSQSSYLFPPLSEHVDELRTLLKVDVNKFYEN